jgi:hypothetical protein
MPDFVVERYDLARIGDQNLSFCGQVQPLGRSPEKSDADEVLQLANLHADGGLGAIQNRRRPTDCADFNDGQEGAEEVRIEIHSGG